MSASRRTPATAFLGQHILLSSSLEAVALRVKAALASDPHATILVFNDSDGRVIDLDLRGSDADIVARLPADSEIEAESSSEAPRGPGRPKLGVVAREVTLLPRHWEWLSAQPGGASVALRKLVEEARRQGSDADRRRQSQEAAYRFISAMAGNEAGFEEAARALFAGKQEDFSAAQASWPEDIRRHAQLLAMAALAAS